MSTYAITGIPLAPGQPLPNRQEITQWYTNSANGYQVSLFLRALAAFQALDVADRLSYFQVAGIHCYPLVPWDGEQQGAQVKSDPFPGFCAHNRPTFPTWHRPYMLLYEQVLWANMTKIIDGWITQGVLVDAGEITTWQTAASQFRLPYWDWARVQPYTGTFGIPQLFTVPTVSIVKPGGEQELFSNPLIAFRNPTLNGKGENAAMGDPIMGKNAVQQHDPNKDIKKKRDPPYNILPWDKCVATSRYGILKDGPDWTNGINNWEFANQGLSDPGWYHGTGGVGSSLSDAVNRMLSPGYFDCWEHFATTKWSPSNKGKPKGFMSLEYIHNIIHNMTGGMFMADSDIDPKTKGSLGLGLGHMSDVPVAAFDPIFWLHHCNIDRLLAIWQKLNPTKWFDKPNPGPNPPKSRLPPDPSPDAPLLPFHYASGNPGSNLYTSNMTKNWKTFNYQYDTLVPHPGVEEDSQQYYQDLRTDLNNLYPGTSSTIKGVLGYGDSEGFNDYIIDVIYDRYALGGLAYSILFFVGEPPTALSGYRQSPNFVGAVFTFSSPIETTDGTISCGNCAAQRDAEVLSKAQIPITIPILARAAPPQPPTTPGEPPQIPIGGPEASGLALDVEHVKRLLQDSKEGLKWEFVALGGERIDKDEFPNTVVKVLRSDAKHGDDGRDGNPLPSYGKYKVLHGAEHQPLGSGFGPDTSLSDMIQDDE